MFAILSCLLLGAAAQQPAPESAFTPLFDDGDLTAWRRTGEATFQWQDGVLHGRDAGSRNSFLVSPRPYGDFELRCEVRIEPGGNSGIQVRSAVDEEGDFVRGWQLEIETGERRWSGGLYEERGRGWLDPLEGQESARAAFRMGEWNEYRILCNGPRVRAWVNGVPCANWEELDAPRAGVIAFQVHGGQDTRVSWRNLRIREIAAGAATPFALHPLCGDGAVLAAAAPALWGTAPPGSRVTLEYWYASRGDASRSAFTQVVADVRGEWRVPLTPHADDLGVAELTARCDDPSAPQLLRARDLVFGDLWLCSGQSNMQWLLADSANAGDEVRTARDPRVRLFTVPWLLADERLASFDAGEAAGTAGNWHPCDPAHAARFSAVAYHFGRALAPHVDRPVGLVVAAWGGTPAEAWTPWWALASDPRLRPLVEGGGPMPPVWAEGSWDPAAIFQGMIAPLTATTFRGVIWYQGESNADRAAEYEDLFPALIHAWRREFRDPLLPFLFVQLAGYRAAVPEPVQSVSWAELREAQRLTALRTPATGMAVAIDVGATGDIHPRRKRPVGERLARAARAVAYGQELVAFGPEPRTMSVASDGAVTVRFDHTGGGLEDLGGGGLRGFALAGPDGAFHHARAELAGEDRVVVRADGVPEPRELRYGWANHPGCNLGNREGLPASPFRITPTVDLFEGGLAAHWIAEDGGAPDWSEEPGGVATVRLLTGGILTRQPLADCELRLEFRVPRAPDALPAQQRGNSGVYLQRRYEIQILDSFGIAAPGAQDCGAVYAQRAPSRNLALPAEVWQRYHLEFRAPRWNADGSKSAPARVTVWHNGLRVQDDVVVNEKTGAGQAEGPEPLPLLLQNHGQAVSFRNVLLSPR
jgi:sialate O-acetylesterase